MNTTDQLVYQYLDDLARMLSDLDPADRDDILAGVRDHFAVAAEGSDGSSAAVTEAIRRLGPPESVAAAARGEADPGAGSGSAGEAAAVTIHLTRHSISSHIGWARTGIALIASATVIPLMLLALNALFTASSTPDPGNWPATMSLFELNGEIAILGAVLLAPAWLAGIIVVGTAQRLTPANRALLGLLGPMTLVALGILVGMSEPLGLVAPIAALGIAAALAAAYRAAWRNSA
ncbi:MAG: hypothetical protein KBB39_13260 [Phycicoccus sp.]|nr:hypothetical protein [Phycicoccus sp.]